MERPDRRLIWSDEAEEDLLAIWRYGAEDWSAIEADEHLHEIEHTCRSLLDAPELGRARDELLRGVRSIPFDPHIIFYRIAPNAIEIMRVRHQREDISDIFQAHHLHL